MDGSRTSLLAPLSKRSFTASASAALTAKNRRCGGTQDALGSAPRRSSSWIVSHLFCRLEWHGKYQNNLLAPSKNTLTACGMKWPPGYRHENCNLAEGRHSSLRTQHYCPTVPGQQQDDPERGQNSWVSQQCISRPCGHEKPLCGDRQSQARFSAPPRVTQV